MENIYWESVDGDRFDFGHLIQSETGSVKLKTADIWLVIGCETNLYEIKAGNVVICCRAPHLSQDSVGQTLK